MKITGPVPDGVAIERDEYGVPHIQVKDLAGAYWGMGYCHALDRGMQMSLMRLLGQGRVAECLDGSDQSVWTRGSKSVTRVGFAAVTLSSHSRCGPSGSR